MKYCFHEKRKQPPFNDMCLSHHKEEDEEGWMRCCAVGEKEQTDEMTVAALLLFGAFSHYPVHRLDRYSLANHMRASRDLKPLLAHNQHPADAVTVEHSSHTVDTG